MFKLLVVVLFFPFLFLGTGMSCDNTIPEGTTLEGKDVEGLTYEEFEEVKEEIIEEWNNREIMLVFSEQEEKVGVQELGLEFYFNGRDKIMRNSADYRLELDYSEEEIETKLEDLFTVVLEEPEDAELIVKQEPVIKEHRVGKRLNLKEAVQLVIEKAREDRITLPLEDYLPAVTTEDIEEMGIKEEISSYSTEFNPTENERNTNINLAAGEIDHTMLSPGDVFNFNKTAGPYTSDRGFREAPVFREGELTSGLGGGVCQVSSTIYNAALLAGLEIVERYSHSLPVWYVPLARDAAVSYGAANLRFRNSLNKHIYIRLFVDKEEGELTATIFGTEEFDVEVGSRIEDKIDPPVKKKEKEDIVEEEVKEEGQYGYEAISWRTLNGDYQFLSRDYYNPQEKIIKVPREEDEEDDEEKEEKEAKIEEEEEEEEEEEDKEKEEKEEDRTSEDPEEDGEDEEDEVGEEEEKENGEEE